MSERLAIINDGHVTLCLLDKDLNRIISVLPWPDNWPNPVSIGFLIEQKCQVASLPVLRGERVAGLELLA